MNTEFPAALVDTLVSRKNTEGGWGYSTRARYSAEATALAVLACWKDLDSTARRSILNRLKQRQLPDGGWPSISPLDLAGNWATAITANALAQIDPEHSSLPGALRSLVAAAPGEAFWLWRLKFRTTDTKVRFEPSKFGWSWVSDSISWVIPTAMAMIALERGRHLKLIQGREVERRIALGRAMLFDRICPGGGWNSGNGVVYGCRSFPTSKQHPSLCSPFRAEEARNRALIVLAPVR